MRNYVGKTPFITIGAAIGCSLAIALAFLAVFWVFTHGTPRSRSAKSTADQSCKNVLILRDAVVTILMDANNQTPLEDSKAHMFYNNSIIKLRKVSC